MSSKPLYYVEYLGWKESRGLYGNDFTEPIVRELLLRRRMHTLPRLTLKLNKKELQISQMGTGRGGGRSASEKVKYAPMPSKDITFVCQSSPPDGDVVACIFLGYNPITKCAVHVHAYRFDRDETAARFAEHVRKIIDIREYRERITGIERDLAGHGHIVMRRGSRGQLHGEPTPDYGEANGGARSGAFYAGDNNSDGQSWESRSDNSGLSPGASRSLQHQPQPQQSQQSQQSQIRYPPAGEVLRNRPDIRIEKKAQPADNLQGQQQLFSSLQEELDYKLHLKEPILLPPKDYDTILRRHGKIETRDQRKSMNSRIVGPNSIFAAPDGASAGDASHSRQSSFSGVAEETSSCASNETENTGAASDASGSVGRPVNGWPSNSSSPQTKPLIKRSSSEIPGNHTEGLWGRQDSHTSAPSVDSDDMAYADGLYYGMQPRAAHGRRGSKMNGGGARNNNDEGAEDEMVLWSSNFTFETKKPDRVSGYPAHSSSGHHHSGHHHHHEADLLSRTAPANSLFRHSVPNHGRDGGQPAALSHRRSSERRQ